MIKQIIAFFKRLFGSKSKTEDFFRVDARYITLNEWTLCKALINDINTERLYELQKPLTINHGSLVNYALYHCAYMIQKKKASHDNYGIRNNAIKRIYDLDKSIGEVISWGYKFSTVYRWMESESHRKIILGDYDSIAIGAMKDLKGKMYICALLIKLKREP